MKFLKNLKAIKSGALFSLLVILFIMWMLLAALVSILDERASEEAIKLIN